MSSSINENTQTLGNELDEEHLIEMKEEIVMVDRGREREREHVLIH